jgi:VCBS repeat-containing protein
VGEVLQAGWQRTTPPAPISVVSGLERSGVLVGNVQLVSISGLKFEDRNGDGVRQEGEQGIAGWTIFIDGNGNGMLEDGETRTTTGADGAYRFEGLLPGTYVIAEVQRTGWVQTTPRAGMQASGSGIAVSLAGSDVALTMEGCSCGGTWSLPDGTDVIDLGAVSTRQSRDITGLTAALQDNRFSGLTGRGVRTVLIDTGIDRDHAFWGPDRDGDGVADRIVYQWDFADNDADASDIAKGHGSHVASLIASQDARYGGVAPGTDLIVLKVFKDSGQGTFGYVEKALQWVLANAAVYNIGVVNMSIGDSGNWTSAMPRYGLGDEFAALAAKDMIIVGAAGNYYNHFNGMGVAYPAADPAVLAVGAVWTGDFGGPWTVSTGATDYTTGADRIAAFSQRDSNLLDIMAPGARFNGANATGGVQTMQGTSQAAGFVSGAAALSQQLAMQVLGRKLSTAEFAEVLRRTGDMVMDGDDEQDNVRNTGASFPRIQFTRLFEEISKLSTTPAPGGGTAGGTGGTGTTRPAEAAAPGVHSVSVTAGQDAMGLDFGNFRLVQLTGTVFDDADGSATRGAGEAGLAGRLVFLDTNGNGLLEDSEISATTGSDGAFSFGPVGPGTYAIRQVLPEGWASTTAQPVTIATTSGQDVAVALGARLANRAPVAAADTATLNASRGGVLNVLANDTDADGDTLAVGALPATSALGAKLTLLNGNVAYDPSGVAALLALRPTESLTDSFTYEVSDGRGGTATATVTLRLDGVNDAPTARPDTTAAGEDAVTLVDVLANDSDPDQGQTALAVTAATRSNLGAVIYVTPEGRVAYDARGVGAIQALAPGQTATDSFTYTVTDPYGATSVATVTVQVSGANDGPVARDDTGTTDEDTVALFAVLSNDRDVDAGQVLTLASLPPRSARGAALSIGADGRVVYDPTTAAELQALGFGQAVEDSFTYVVGDGAGGLATATAIITVVGRPDPQLAIAASTGEDAAVVVAVREVTLASVAGTSRLGARIAIVDGRISYDPTSALALQRLNPGETATDTVTFKATTASGEPVDGVLTVTVSGANDAPQGGRVNLSTDADQALQVDPLTAASDRDLGAVLALGTVPAASALGAALTVVEGKVVYDPTASATLRALLLGEVANDTFQVTVRDQLGATGVLTFAVQVAGRNAAGGVIQLSPQATGEDQILRFGPGAGYTLVSVNPASERGGVVRLRSGQVEYDPTRAAALQALQQGASALDTVSVTLRNAAGAEFRGQAAITVGGANDVPVARGDQRFVWDNASAIVDVLGNDTDADAGAVLSITGLPALSLGGAKLTVVDGRVVYDPTVVTAYRNLPTGQSLTDSFTYSVTDERGATSTATVAVTITGRNDVPVAVADVAATNEDTAIRINVVANDTDLDSPALAVASVAQTSALGASIRLLPDGTVSYDPGRAPALQRLAKDAVVVDTFAYWVRDPDGAVARGTVTVTVTGQNDAPVARNYTTATADNRAFLTSPLANVTDVDQAAVRNLSVGPRSTLGAALTVQADGRVLYDPRGALEYLALGEVVSDTVTYTITDEHGASSTATVTIVVTGRNDPPVAVADNAVAGSRTPVDIAVLANDTDRDRGAALTVLQVQGTSRLGAALSINPDGTVRYDASASATLAGLPPGATRTDRFTYTVTDQYGATSTGTVTVTVTGQAASPTLLMSDARTTRRTAAVPPAEELVIDLASRFEGFEAGAAGAGGTSSWQVGFVADGTGGADPNRNIVVRAGLVA